MSWNIGAATFRFVGDLSGLRKSANEAKAIGRDLQRSKSYDTTDLRKATADIDRLTSRLDALVKQQRKLDAVGPSPQATKVYKQQNDEVTKLAASFDKLAKAAQSASNATRAGEARSSGSGQAKSDPVRTNNMAAMIAARSANQVSTALRESARASAAATSAMAANTERDTQRAGSALRKLAGVAAGVGVAGGAAAGVAVAYKNSDRTRSAIDRLVGRVGNDGSNPDTRVLGQARIAALERNLRTLFGAPERAVGRADRAVTNLLPNGRSAFRNSSFVRSIHDVPEGGIGERVGSIGKGLIAMAPMAVAAFGMFKKIQGGGQDHSKESDLSRRMRTLSDLADRGRKGYESFQGNAGATLPARLISASATAATGGFSLGNVAKSGIISARDKAFEVSRNFKLSSLKKLFGDATVGADGAINKTKMLGSAFDKIASVAGGMVLYNAFTKGVHWAKAFAEETVMAGARIKELDVALGVMGHNAGYTLGALHNQVDTLKSLGIETKQAQGALTQFMKVGLDIAKLPELADVARNSAIFSGADTSEQLQNITYGIQTRQPEVLRTAGLNVNFGQAQSQEAGKLHKSVSALTEQEKVQAGLNAVLQAGKSVQGAYEASMGTASKQLRSMTRYTEELKNSIGQHLEPAFASGVKAANDFIRGLTPAFGKDSVLGSGLDTLASKAETVFNKIGSAGNKFTKGGGLESVVSKVRQGANATKGSHGLIAAAAAYQGSTFLGGMGSIGQLMAPIAPYQAAILALIATHKELSGAFKEVGKSANQAFQMVASVALPVMAQLESFISSNADTLKGLGKDMGTLLTANAYGWAGALKSVQHVLGPVTGGVSLFGQALDKTNAVAITGFVGRAGAMGAKVRDVTGTVTGMVVKMYALRSILGARNLFSGLSGLTNGATSMADIGRAFQTMEQGGAQAISRTITNAAKLTKVMSVMGMIMPVVAGGVMALTLGLQVYGWWAARAAAATKKLGEEALAANSITTDFAGRSAVIGPGQSITEMIDGYRTVMKKANEAQTAKQKADDEMSKAAPRSGWRDWLGNAGAKVGGESDTDQAARKKALMAASKTQEEAAMRQRLWDAAEVVQKKNLVAAYDDFERQVSQTASSVTSSSQDQATSVSASIAAIDATLGQSTASWIDYSKLTASQMQSLEDQTNKLTTVTEKWGSDAAGIMDGVTSAQVGGLDDLVSHFEVTRSKVAYFWKDLNTLKTSGLNQQALDDLVAAGPEQAGDAMARMVSQIDNAADGAAKGWIERINEHSNAIQEMNRLAVKAIAEQTLQKGGTTPSTTEAQSMAKDMVKIREEIKTNAALMAGAGDEIVSKSNMSSPAIEYRKRVDALIAAVQDGTVPLEEVMAKYRDTLQMRDVANDDKSISGVVGNMDHILSAMVDQRANFEKAGNALGVTAGQGLTVGFGEFSTAGIAEVLDAAGQQMLVGAQEIAKVFGTYLVTNADAAIAEMGGMGVSGKGIDDFVSHMGAAADATVIPEKIAKMLQEDSDAAKGAKAAYDDWVNGLKRVDQTDAFAKKANEAQKLADSTEDGYKAIERVGDALEHINHISLRGAQFGTSDAAENLAKALLDVGDSSTTAAAHSRALRSATDAVMSSIQAEAEAAVKAGAVHDDVGSITAYMASRLAQVTAGMPGLIQGFRSGAQAAELLDAAIQRAQKTLSLGLDVKVNLDEALAGAQEAFYALKQQMDDNRALLTGRYLGDKEHFEISTTSMRSVISYTQALKAEAEAMARAGKIGSDSASIQKHIKDGLVKVRSEYPELASQIDSYIDTLKDAGAAGEANDQVTMEVQIANAMSQLNSYQSALGQVPSMAQTLLQIKIDEASVKAAKDELDTLQRDIVDGATATFSAPPMHTAEEYAKVWTEIGAAADKIKDALTPDPEQTSTMTPTPDFGASGNSRETGASLMSQRANRMSDDGKDYYQGSAAGIDDLFSASANTLKTFDELKAAYASVGQEAEYSMMTGKKFNIANTKTGDIFDQLTDSVADEALGMVHAGKLAKDWDSIQGYVQKRVKDLTKDMPLLAGSVDEYITTIRNVPKSATTDLKADSQNGDNIVRAYLTGSIAPVRNPAITPIGADINGGAYAMDVWENYKKRGAGAVTTDVYANIDQAVANIRALGNFIGSTISGVSSSIGSQVWSWMTTKHDDGGYLTSGNQMVTNNTGMPELVANPKQMRGIQNLMGRAGLSGDMHAALEAAAGGAGGIKLFDNGGWLPQGEHLVANRSGASELILNPQQIGNLVASLQALAEGSDSDHRVQVGVMNVQTNQSASSWMQAGAYAAVAGVKAS